MKCKLFLKWRVEAELMSLTAGGQKLLCSLVVRYRIHMYCQMAAEQLGYSVTAATASASNVFILSVCACVIMAKHL